jgi:hypothetical protein
MSLVCTTDPSYSQVCDGIFLKVTVAFIFVMSVKCDVHANEEPKCKKKKKVMSLLEKVEMFCKLNTEMSRTVVVCHFGLKKLMIYLIKKDEDKIRGSINACVPLSRISCISHLAPLKRWKGPSVKAEK